MEGTSKVQYVLVLLLLGVLLFEHGATSEVTYTFGINLALNGSQSGSFSSVQSDALLGYSIWKDWWNSRSVAERTTRSGVTFKVDLHVEQFSDYSTAPGNQEALFQTYYNMSKNSSIDFFLSPVACPWGVALRNYSYYELGLPLMVASGDSSEAFYQVPGSYGTPTANILSLTSWLPYLRVAKAKTVAVLQVNDYVFQSEMCYGVVAQAPLNGLEVVANDIMPFDWSTLGEVEGNGDSSTIWTEALDRIIALNPDAIAICDYGFGSEFALSYIRSKNWVPKSILLSTLYLPFKDPSLLAFVTTPSPYSPRAKFPAQQNFTDSAGFDELVMARYGKHANNIIAQATLAGMIFSEAIWQSSENTTQAIETSLATSQFSSFMGTPAFDVHHRQTLSSLVTQYAQSTDDTLVVGPALAASDEFVYPMPSWSERTFNPKWGSGVEIAGAVLMALGGAVTIGWTIFMIVHWTHPVMLAASPVFCLAMLGGSLLVFISIFNWMPNLINDSICNLRPWLLPLGFMIMFGSLIAKTDRICRVYNAVYKSKTPNVIRISNTQVSLIVLSVAVVQSILSILMVTVTRLQSQIHVVDQYRIHSNYWVCTFPKALKILFGINVAYAGLLLAWGSYLAYHVRKVPIRVYDESKVIGFSIYNTAFFGAIVIVVQLAVGNNNRNVTFMITAVCCFLGATITTSTLFVSKWFAIYRPSAADSDSSSISSGPYRSNSRSSASENSKQSGTETKALKKKNAKLQKRIKDLEKELAMANAKLEKRGEDQNRTGHDDL